MKGDFSRIQASHDANPAGASLSALWLQQGRPLLDADFNQAMEQQRQRLAQAMASLIGGPAGPAADLGFAVTPLCALVLNDPPTAGRQCLWFPAPGPAGPPPHTVEAKLVTFGDEEDLVLAVSVDDPPPHAAPPETMQLTLRAPAEASGPILVRPGAYAVRLRQDRTVVVERPGVAEPVSLGILAADAWTDLLLAETHHNVHLRLGDHGVVTVPIARVLLQGGTAFAIGADDPAAVRQTAPGLLSCHISVLRRWSVAMDLDRLAASLARKVVPQRHLAFDLDVTRITADGTDAARMHDRRPGHHAHAALAWSGTAPRLTLERYTLSAGSYVVDGLAARAMTAMTGGEQPFLPDPSVAAASGPGSHLIYLDLWDRGVDALEDPSLADPALQGVDTVIRAETIWQVRSAPIDLATPADAAMAGLRKATHGGLSIWREPSSAPRQGNGLLRVEIHHPGWTDSATLTEPRRAALIEAELTDRSARLVVLPDGAPALAPGAPVRVYPASDETPVPSGLLTQVEQVAAPRQVILAALPDGMAAGKLRLLPIASFKWSRGNAATSYPLTSVQQAVDDQGDTVAVALLASPGLSGFDIRPGDWLELTDRTTALMGRPGRFLKVRSLQEDLLQIALDGWTDALPFAPAEGVPCRLTTWSQRRYWHVHAGEQAPASDAPWPRPASAEPLEIDPGVNVQFEPDCRYRSGDYWTAPLREESLDVADWQRAGADRIVRPPQGINHHLAPLALLRVDPWEITAADLRHAFPSLRQLAQSLPQDTADFLTACADWARQWHLTAPDRSVSPAALVAQMLDLWLPKPASDLLAGLARWATAWNLPAPAESLPPPKLLDRIMRGWLQTTFSDELRLLAQGGARVEGFSPTGETVAMRCLEAATWYRMPHHRRRDVAVHAAGHATMPSGPGQGAMVGPVALFVGSTGIWAATAPHAEWHRVEALGEAPGAAVAVHGGAVILAGGESGRAHDAILRIDPVGLSREPLGTLAVPVSQATAVVIGNTLFVLGGLGRNGRPVATVQAFDLAHTTRHGWFGRKASQARVCGRLPSARAHHAAIAWDGMVLVAGGEDEHGHPAAEVWLINPATAAAMPRAALPAPCRAMRAAAVQEGMVLAGGVDANGAMLSEVLLYRPMQDRWASLASLPMRGHSLALLADSDGTRLLALGGRGVDADLEGGHALLLQRTMSVLSPRSP